MPSLKSEIWRKWGGCTCVYLYWLILRTWFSFCSLVLHIAYCSRMTFFLIKFVSSQSLIWKISDTVELYNDYLHSEAKCWAWNSGEGANTLSCLHCGGKSHKNTVFRNQIATASEVECRCGAVLLCPVPSYPNHLTTSWLCTLGTHGPLMQRAAILYVCCPHKAWKLTNMLYTCSCLSPVSCELIY